MTRGKKIALWVVAIVVGIPVLFFLFEQVAHLLPANY